MIAVDPDRAEQVLGRVRKKHAVGAPPGLGGGAGVEQTFSEAHLQLEPRLQTCYADGSNKSRHKNDINTKFSGAASQGGGAVLMTSTGTAASSGAGGGHATSSRAAGGAKTKRSDKWVPRGMVTTDDQLVVMYSEVVGRASSSTTTTTTSSSHERTSDVRTRRLHVLGPVSGTSLGTAAGAGGIINHNNIVPAIDRIKYSLLVEAVPSEVIPDLSGGEIRDDGEIQLRKTGEKPLYQMRVFFVTRALREKLQAGSSGATSGSANSGTTSTTAGVGGHSKPCAAGGSSWTLCALSKDARHAWLGALRAASKFQRGGRTMDLCTVHPTDTNSFPGAIKELTTAPAGSSQTSTSGSSFVDQHRYQQPAAPPLALDDGDDAPFLVTRLGIGFAGVCVARTAPLSFEANAVVQQALLFSEFDDPDLLVYFEAWRRGKVEALVGVPLSHFARNTERVFRFTLKDTESIRQKGVSFENLEVAELVVRVGVYHPFANLFKPLPRHRLMQQASLVQQADSRKTRIFDRDEMSRVRHFFKRAEALAKRLKESSQRWKDVERWEDPAWSFTVLLALVFHVLCTLDYTVTLLGLLLLGKLFGGGGGAGGVSSSHLVARMAPADAVQRAAEVEKMLNRVWKTTVLLGAFVRPPQMAILERIESERCWFWGGFSSSRLLFTDPPPWRDAHTGGACD
eukprot:g11141.t1